MSAYQSGNWRSNHGARFLTLREGKTVDGGLWLPAITARLSAHVTRDGALRLTAAIECDERYFTSPEFESNAARLTWLRLVARRLHETVGPRVFGSLAQ